MEIIFSVFLILFTIIGYYEFRKLVNPITIFVSWSLLIMLMGLWSNIFITNYSLSVYLIIIISYVVFVIGTLLGNRTTIKKSSNKKVDFNRLKKCIYFLSIIVDVCIIIYIYGLASSFGISRILSDLSEYNMAIQDGYFSGKLYYQMLFLAIPLSLFILYFLLKVKNKRNLFMKIQFLVCFLPFISVRRDTLFKMILLNMILWYLLGVFNQSEKRINRKFKKYIKILFILIITVSFMSITQKLLNKSIDITNMNILGIKIPDFLISPIVYLLGSFPYFNNIFVDISYKGFLISTLRIPYMYLQPFWGGIIDLTNPFSLSFRSIATGMNLMYNTAPIQYYTLIELGYFYPIFYFILGIFSGFLYKKFINNQGFSETMWVVIIFSLLFWSIREYILVYLSTWILIFSVVIVTKIVLIKE
ncbi:oligosaccharide repeat unit polymerase [Clostridium perfringens]|uniref:O-antigen polymerase n=2 Tax=Clostridium perfringens TaxID=1502 RepID=UPI001ABA2E8A|nr:O-antigen polymerase [Clostridium perfringens]MBO3325691.1 oligosaccharide repeat unit polymerase [Clostridium perfringens]